MFESDQHEFDEEYEGYRHPAPPSPPPAPTAPTPAQSQPAPAPVAAATIHEPVVMPSHHQGVEEEPEEEDPQADEYDEREHEEFFDPAERKDPPKPKQPNLMLIAGFAALVIFGVVAFYLARPKQNTPQAGDMGPGIVAADGLRGHLETKWEGDAKTGKLAYQLRIEPMEDRWQAGFSRVVLNPPLPLSVNIRLLDSTGFALCGKEVDFHFDPQNAGVPALADGDKKMSKAERTAAIEAARQSQITQMRAAEAAREHGKDIFQNQTTTDNQVSAVNVQGTLPCSPDQYRRADYWDFNTNFPTLQEQAVLLDPKGALARGEFAPPPHPGKRTLSRLPKEGFVIQGDDRITGYDSAHGTLWAEGKTFQIDKRFGQATASAWANNYALIHYRCDQQANCALTAAGEAAVLHARLNE